MLDNLGGSAQGDLSANASVGADGSVSAGASGSGSAGLGGALGAAVSGAASLAAGAAAGLAAGAGAGLAAGASTSLGASLGAGLTAQASFSAGANGKGPGVRPPDPWLVYRFHVEIQGLGPLRFQSCGPITANMNDAAPTPPPAPPTSGTPQRGTPTGGSQHPAGTTPPATTQPSSNVSPANSGANGTRPKLPGTSWTWQPLVLKRGMAKDGTALWAWLYQASQGHYDPRDVTVTLFDNEGSLGMMWTFKKSYPKSWTIPLLDGSAAGANNVVLESLTLNFSGVDFTYS
jgi:phage tail-like protein